MTKWETFRTYVTYVWLNRWPYVRHFFGWFVCKWSGCRMKFSAHYCLRCGKKAWWKD